MTDLNVLLERRPDWYDEANCHGLDADMFFVMRGESDGAAKAVCNACTVKDECLNTHIEERWGVFGGLSERQRRLVRKARREGRPDPVFEDYYAACGTDTAYKRHVRNKTAACQPCKDAHAAANLEWKRGAA